MPIRPELSLDVPTFTPPNPLNQLAQVTQIQSAMQQQQIGALQLQQLQDDRREMERLQQKLTSMGQSPDLKTVAQAMMRSPKTMQAGVELMQKLRQQEGFSQFLQTRGMGGAPSAAAPATAPAGAIASPVPMTRSGEGVPPIAVGTDVEDAARPMGPQAPITNALASAPTNALTPRALRTPEAIRNEMMQLAQFGDVPQAKAYMKTLESELAEAVKPPTLHNVPGVGAVNPRTGQTVVPEVQKPTATQQDYDRAVREGFKGTLLDFKKAVAEAGRAVSNITIEGQKLTPLQQQADEKFAPDYNAWKMGGGVTAAKNVAQIKSVMDQLHAGKQYSGPMIGVTPDVVLAFTNPNALDARQRVEQVAQESLRSILGAQFTQKEGEAFIARVYDPKLKPEQNAARLRALFTQLQAAAEQKQAMVDYADEHGTLRGFKGKAPSIADFYDALDVKPLRSSTRRGEAPSSASVPTIPKSYTGDPDLWQYMTPEDRALWTK